MEHQENPWPPRSGDPYQRLWLSVIEQAFKDALKGAARPLEGDHLGAEAVEQRRALMWFKDGDEDFRRVCHFAGLDPNYVREHVIPRLNAVAIDTRPNAGDVPERARELAA